MTNHELIDIINKKIDEIVNERIKELQKYENESGKNYFEALRYHLHQSESKNAGVYFKSELNDLLQSLDLNTDDSRYKEMWEELKSKIKSRKTEREQDERYYQTNKYYYFASEQRTKQLEDADILSVMDDIEAERGIE